MPTSPGSPLSMTSWVMSPSGTQPAQTLVGGKAGGPHPREPYAVTVEDATRDHDPDRHVIEELVEQRPGSTVLGHGRGCGRPEPAGRAASDQAGQRRLRRVTGDVEHLASSPMKSTTIRMVAPGQLRRRPVGQRRQVPTPALHNQHALQTVGTYEVEADRSPDRAGPAVRRSARRADGARPEEPWRQRGQRAACSGWSAGRPPSRCACPPPVGRSLTSPMAFLAPAHRSARRARGGGRRSAKARRSSTTWSKCARYDSTVT